ncbi:MAG: hypothetical protein ACOY99_08715 [Pseudomonadota bacterium]
MTRVASFAQSQALLQGILNNQSRIFEAQKQVNTGKKTDEFRGIASQTSTLVGAKSLLARTQSYLNAGAEADRTISAYDVQLNFILENARNLRQTVLEAISNNEAVGFGGILGDAFNLITSALNTKVGGKFLFSGSRSDQPAVNTTTLSDLIALPTASDAFDNDQLKASTRVTDGFDLSYGVLAEDIGSGLFASIKRLAEFNAGPGGPIDGALTAAQRTFLEGELQQLDGAIQTAQNQQVLNGLNAKKLGEVLDLQRGQTAFLEVFVADIEDVDIAEAITRLNNDRTALEASYRVVGSVSRLSLVQFL